LLTTSITLGVLLIGELLCLMFWWFSGWAGQGVGDTVRLSPSAVSAAMEYVLKRGGAGRLYADPLQRKQPSQQDYDLLL